MDNEKKKQTSQNILFYVAQKKVSRTGRVAKGWKISSNFPKVSEIFQKILESFRNFPPFLQPYIQVWKEISFPGEISHEYINDLKYSLTILKQKYIERNPQNNLKLLLLFFISGLKKKAFLCYQLQLYKSISYYHSSF